MTDTPKEIACCQRFSENTGSHNVGIEAYDDRWYVNGCCGGGCFVLSDINYCPFCGAPLAASGETERLAKLDGTP
jgi:hypothetical protein